MKDLKPGFQLVDIVSALLILLWIYTAVAKLADSQEFHRQLNSQVFSLVIADALFYILPVVELMAVALLYYKPLQFYGLCLSLLLLIVFTVYTALVVGGQFSRIPCICGGIISTMSWKTHFVFNLVFVAVATTGIISSLSERRMLKS
jgi:putative oxidoreductase